MPSFRSLSPLTRCASLGLAALLLSTSAFAAAEKPKYNPAIVYFLPTNMGKTKNTNTDSAFIDSARIGIEKATNDFGTNVPQYRMTGTESAATITAEIKKLADSGASPIIALGSQNVVPVLNLAERYPNTQFTVIDGLVPPLFPNVQSILFRDNEGSFLVGFIAAKISGTGHIGFVGGLDSPVIRNFAAGYTQGAKYANADVDVTTDMVGTTANAWNNPDKARELAITQYNNGIDVIFAAAGGSGIGVLNAAQQTHKYAIGVDTNQNGIFPGRVLTSLVKRVDIATYDSLKRSHDGTWSPGIKYLGIKEGALDYAVDQNNSSLISEKLIEEVSNAKERIINGIITVDAYTPK